MVNGPQLTSTPKKPERVVDVKRCPKVRQVNRARITVQKLLSISRDIKQLPYPPAHTRKKRKKLRLSPAKTIKSYVAERVRAGFMLGICEFSLERVSY
jgi:hypothetical protein